MADSTQLDVWEDMAKEFKDKVPYEDSGIIDFLKLGDFERNPNFLLGMYLKGERLLDVGCSLGLFDQIFIDAGLAVVGIDQIRYAVEEAAKKVPKAVYMHMNAKDMGFKNEFDVVFTNTVLQHMKSDLKETIIKNIHNALKDGGIAFISECTFTKDNWNSVPGRSVYKENVTDGYSYTVSGWVKLFNKLGFRFIIKHPKHDWYLFEKIS